LRSISQDADRVSQIMKIHDGKMTTLRLRGQTPHVVSPLLS
jgi:hypothetical protein